MKDNVNHPSHYTSHPSGVECIQITEHYGFCIGHCIKYLWRSGLKEGNSDIQDLEKAMWYLKREIDSRKSKENGTTSDFNSEDEQMHQEQLNRALEASYEFLGMDIK